MSDSSDSVDIEPQSTQPIDICNDGGVLKVILKKGKGTKPVEGSEVKVHYVGTLEDGTKFDSSRDRNDPFTFTLGKGVITGWSKCVATMKKGELCRVTIRSDYGYGESGSPPKIPGGATLIFEIELLSFQNEKDITKSKDGGVLKKVLKEAPKSAYERPKYESVCSVHIKTYNGDTVYEDTDKQIEIGSVGSNEGLDMALEEMKKEEKALFFVKSKYAYGQNGNPQLQIPPNTDLTYEITMNDFTKVKEKWGMELNEKKEAAAKRKNDGNELFTQGHYSHALKKYKKALEYLDDSSSKLEPDEKKHVNIELSLPCYLNSAMCHIKLKEYQKALDSCEKALQIDSRNVKGLWRRGVARTELGFWTEAKRDFTEALTIEPENKSIQQSMNRLKALMKKQDEIERERYKKLFS